MLLISGERSLWRCFLTCLERYQVTLRHVKPRFILGLRNLVRGLMFFDDSTVIDISRSDVLTTPDFFPEVIRARYPHLAERARFSDRLSPDQFAQLLGRAVVGNLRGLILACNRFKSKNRYP